MVSQHRSRRQVAGTTLLLAGAVALLAAVGADWLGVGTADGIGTSQKILFAIGAVVIAIGLALGGGRAILGGYRRWHAAQVTDRISAGRTLLLAAVLGLSAGLAEVAIFQWQRGEEELVVVAPGFVWMAPVADAMFLLLIGVVLVGLAWRWRGRPLFAPAVTVMGGTAALCVIEAIPGSGRVDLYARLLVAAAGGVLFMRAMRGSTRLAWRWVRGATVALTVVVLALALLAHLPGRARERRAIAALAPAETGAPNILLIILDTVRAASLSLLGYERETTPFLEELARHAIVFDSAFSTSPWTLPSHATMFTGRYPQEMSANWQTPLDSTWPTIAEQFRDAGYVTAGFVANLHYGPAAYGLSRGFTHYEDFDISLGSLATSSRLLSSLLGLNSPLRKLVGNYQVLDRKYADELNPRVLRWLAQYSERPHFLFLNYFDAHAPYWPPSPYDTLFAPPQERRNPTLAWGWTWTPEQVAQERDAYDRSLAYLDDSLRRLFAGLEAQGFLENTIVMVTSDHGEHLGEHGFMRHSRTLYQPLLHVPLLVQARGRVPEGVRIGTPVSLRDLPATIMDLAAIRSSFTFPGQSLRTTWTGEPRAPGPLRAEVAQSVRTPARYPASHGDMQTFIAEGHQYIANTNGTEELYSLANDPDQLNNLITDADRQPLIARLRSFLTLDLASLRAVASIDSTRSTGRGGRR
jgi:arylsulfatase A-like enzyme